MSSTISSLGSSQISSEITDYEDRLAEPVTQLDAQITTDKADISAWGTIQGTLSTLSTSLSGIADLSTINTRNASVGTSSVLSATAGSAAQTGTYSVDVKSLASVQEIYSSAAVAKTASAKLGSATGNSTLSFTIGSGSKAKTETVTVGSGSMTLNGIASAINKMAGGVKAGVVTTATGAELTLQSSSTGASQAFSVSGTGSLAQFDYSNSTTGTTSPMMFSAQTAKNSSLTLNGVPIIRSSNNISSAMPGVSLTLTSKGSSTLNIGSSPTAITSAVGTVASDLNSALSTISKETFWAGSSTTTASASASSAAKSGGLAGNTTAESISNQLLSAVSGAAASGMTSNSIGLTVSSKGTVALDSTTFAAAYTQNPTAVQKLLGEIQTSLSTATKQALGSSTSTSSDSTATVGGGTIAAQTDSYTNTITSINTEISQMEKTDTVELNNLAAAYSTAESAATNASVTQMYLDIYTSPTTSSS
ncbi:flagellar filament capping protein FliD [Acidocella sp.]|jgi:flagellar hook-associated protein 2|uniref:flagellar filament capping protein FliD n=1 Tax=Acidocella sp. TaxID=50710 RepID=UPI002F40A323